MKRGGDDLEDDFIHDELVASDNDDDNDDDDKSEDPSRFFSDEEEGQNNHDAALAKEQALVKKKRKWREKDKERKAKKMKLDVAETPSSTIAAQSPLMLSDYLFSMQKRTFSTMSQIELDDLRIPEKSIADTSLWSSPRTLDRLVDFIAEVLPTLRKRLSQRSQSNGAPTLMFMTAAAMRAADATRALRDRRLRGEKAGEVAKLFAKHFKVKQHVRHLNSTKVGVAVGTPNRIGKLLCDTDALALSALTHVILDVTFRDQKQRSLLDIPEVRDDVFKTVLGCPKMVDAIKAGKVQVVLF